MIVKEIEAMQEIGSSPDTCGGYMVRMEESSGRAAIRNDIRAALETTKSTVNELVSKLTLTSEVDQGKFISGLHDLYSGERGTDFDDVVWAYIQGQTPLTETSHGRQVPASGVTAYKLKLEFLKAISQIARGDFDVSKGDYAHTDEVSVCIRKFMKAVELIYKPKGDEGDWDKLGVELKGILCSMRSAEGTALFGQRMV